MTPLPFPQLITVLSSFLQYGDFFLPYPEPDTQLYASESSAWSGLICSSHIKSGREYLERRTRTISGEADVRHRSCRYQSICLIHTGTERIWRHWQIVCVSTASAGLSSEENLWDARAVLILCEYMPEIGRLVVGNLFSRGQPQPGAHKVHCDVHTQTRVATDKARLT